MNLYHSRNGVKNVINNKKVFTLVELLAVIVILAIILVIAVPKVMSIISDSKKATLENTAKMIAGSAEKAKIQNTVLGKEENITCESVSKYNKEDYDTRNITFDGNTAKVTIKGKGKFEGLYVCSGTNTNAEATDEECGTQVNDGIIASSYIEDLLEREETLHNGLIVDDTGDQNIRYKGDDPNNKVYFNCKDTYNEKKYGSEGYDYENACEIWRIIGVFDVEKTTGGTPEKRLKILGNTFTDGAGNVLSMSWDSSASDINGGGGINQWGEVKDANGNIIYEGSDLMRMLNGYYIGEESTCTYCSNSKQGTCANDCSNSITPLSATSLNMIDDALWSTRAFNLSGSYTAKQLYELEKNGEATGKICSATKDDGSENTSCNDKVIRTTTWIGKVGLLYPSDWGYANTGCTALFQGDNSCYKTNWLYTGSLHTITPLANTNVACYVYMLWAFPPVQGAGVNIGVKPTLYLSSNVEIIGGYGTDDYPYILKDGE